MAIDDNYIYIGAPLLVQVDTDPETGDPIYATYNLFRVNRNTGEVDYVWNPLDNGEATALTIEGNTLYIGGTFSSVSGVARNKAAAINTTTLAVEPWDPNIAGPGAVVQ